MMRRKTGWFRSRRSEHHVQRQGMPSVLLFGFLLASASSAQIIDQQPFDDAADVGDWKVISPTYSGLSHDAELGVMALANFATSMSASAQFQYCIDNVVEGQAYDVALAAQIPMQSATGWVSVVMIPTTELACFGSGLAPLGSDAPISSQSDTTWNLLQITGAPVPAGAKAVFVRIFMNKSTAGDNMKVLIDDVLVERTDIFGDGFESGSTANWI